MKDITFVDLEVTLNTCRVVDIGAVRSDRTPFHPKIRNYHPIHD